MKKPAYLFFQLERIISDPQQRSCPIAAGIKCIGCCLQPCFQPLGFLATSHGSDGLINMPCKTWAKPSINEAQLVIEKTLIMDWSMAFFGFFTFMTCRGTNFKFDSCDY